MLRLVLPAGALPHPHRLRRRSAGAAAVAAPAVRGRSRVVGVVHRGCQSRRRSRLRHDRSP